MHKTHDTHDWAIKNIHGPTCKWGSECWGSKTDNSNNKLGCSYCYTSMRCLSIPHIQVHIQTSREADVSSKTERQTERGIGWDWHEDGRVRCHGSDQCSSEWQIRQMMKPHSDRTTKQTNRLNDVHLMTWNITKPRRHATYTNTSQSHQCQAVCTLHAVCSTSVISMLLRIYY